MNARIKWLCVAGALAITVALYHGVAAYGELVALRHVDTLAGEYMWEEEFRGESDPRDRPKLTLWLCVVRKPVVLSMANTDVQKEDLWILHWLPGVQVLWLSNTDLGDDTVGELGGLSGLAQLHIAGARFSPSAIQRLRESLAETEIVTEHVVPF